MYLEDSLTLSYSLRFLTQILSLKRVYILYISNCQSNFARVNNFLVISLFYNISNENHSYYNGDIFLSKNIYFLRCIRFTFEFFSLSISNLGIMPNINLYCKSLLSQGFHCLYPLNQLFMR